MREAKRADMVTVTEELCFKTPLCLPSAHPNLLYFQKLLHVVERAWICALLLPILVTLCTSPTSLNLSYLFCKMKIIIKTLLLHNVTGSFKCVWECASKVVKHKNKTVVSLPHRVGFTQVPPSLTSFVREIQCELS